MKEVGVLDLDAIFWDFDGVLLASNEIRDLGFSEVLKAYPEEEVAQLMHYHQANGGLSRYVKFRYFFEEVRGESITEEEINQWAGKFSDIMMKLLINPTLQIRETQDFVKKNQSRLPMYVVSGSDQVELRKICEAHGIASYFKRIHGSPKPKKKWVSEIIKEEQLSPSNCVLIGDSVNDYETAISNRIHFMGYGNSNIVTISNLKLKL